jgi:hypothetical protein
MVENIFTHVVFTDYILPWVLVFVIIFAILEKTNVLGEDKKQINAIIGAISGLILLAFPGSRDLIVKFIPVMVVLAVILFVFILLYSFVSGEKEGDPLSKGAKIGLGVAIGIFIIAVWLDLTGLWDPLWSYLSSSNAGANIIFILIAVGAVAAVLFAGKKKEDDDED